MRSAAEDRIPRLEDVCEIEKGLAGAQRVWGVCRTPLLLTQVTVEDDGNEVLAVAIHAAAQKPRDLKIPGGTPEPPGPSRPHPATPPADIMPPLSAPPYLIIVLHTQTNRRKARLTTTQSLTPLKTRISPPLQQMWPASSLEGPRSVWILDSFTIA